MKSPWKFLVQLASRGRSDEAEDDSTDSVTKGDESPKKQDGAPPAKVAVTTKSGQSEEQNGEVAGATSDLAVVDNVAPTSPVVEVEPAQNGEDAPNQSIASVRELVPKSARRVTLSDKKHPLTSASAKAKSTGGTVDTKIAADEVEVKQTGSHEPSFSSDVANLDESIKQLRLQLAEKLRLQNAQLKGMLVRFERFKSAP